MGCIGKNAGGEIARENQRTNELINQPVSSPCEVSVVTIPIIKRTH